MSHLCQYLGLTPFLIGGEPYWKVGRVWRDIVTNRLP
jgi:hypothetical protein